jgi:transcriptional regulator with XRE-family HTH domain
MRLKQQLEHLLAQHNMNPTQLSRKANVPRQTVGNWLTGQSPKNFDQVKRVADLFNVTLDHLLYGFPSNTNLKTKQSIIEELINERFEIRIIKRMDDG